MCLIMIKKGFVLGWYWQLFKLMLHHVTSALISCRKVCSLAASPERNHVAQFGRQAAQLIGRQVQVDQVGQLGDVGRDSGEVVVVDVQCRQVGECP